MKKFTTEEIRDLFIPVMLGEISFSRMVEVINERVNEIDELQYKDGDFVVNETGNILIFRKKDGDFIYDHAFLGGGWLLFTSLVEPSLPGIKRYATEEEKQILLDALAKVGKRWNAEKLCVEDIPKRKFKKGDKVRIKAGILSKTHDNVDPSFVEEMDVLLGKTMTVYRYTDDNNYVECEETEYAFLEEWLEPYEELKKGDLAIFWDNRKEYALIKFYDRLNVSDGYIWHQDIRGYSWYNAIKFESKEQYERLIKGEI